MKDTLQILAYSTMLCAGLFLMICGILEIQKEAYERGRQSVILESLEVSND